MNPGTDSSLSTSSPSVDPYQLSNITTQPAAADNDTDDERNERLAVIEVAISATILFLAVVGNSVVVVCLMLKTGKLSRMHLMMFHLSLADLSVAFFQVLPQMVWDITFRFQGGAFLCGAVKFLQLVTMYASSYVLVSTAVDRYVAICKPFLSQKWTSRHAHLLVLAAWVASLVFSLPQIFIFSLSELGENSGVYDCWASFHPAWTLQLYVSWNALSIFIAPSLCLAVLYGHISLAVWNSSKMAENLAPRYIALSKNPKTRQDRTQTCHNSPLTPDPGSRHSKTAWNCNTSPSAEDDSDHPLTSASSFQERVCLSTPDLPHAETRNGSGQNNVAAHQQVDVARVPRSKARMERVQYDFAELKKTRRKADGGKGQPDTPHDSLSSVDVQPSERLLSVKSLGGRSPQCHTPGGGARGRSVGISRAKIKTIKLTLTVIICYLVCWTPFYVAQLWAAFDENIPYDSIFFTIVLLLASVNSCTNPWIYMVFSDTICNSLKALPASLACCPCCESDRSPPATRGRHYTHTASCSAASSSFSPIGSQRSSRSANGMSRL